MRTVKLLVATVVSVLALSWGTSEVLAQPAEHEAEGQHAEGQHAAGGEHAAGGHEAHAHPAIDASKYINWFGFDYGSKDIYGGPLGDGKMSAVDVNGKEVTLPEEEKMSPPFIFMLINFGLLLIILAKFAAPAGKKLAEERHDLIKNALDEAAKLRKQAQEKLTEYETRLKDADSEIKKLVEGLRTDAEADKQRILAQAAAQAALLKKDAELRIAAEIAMARAQLTKEVTAAATAATEKLLRDHANADDQAKLVATFIADVQQAAIRNEGPR